MGLTFGAGSSDAELEAVRGGVVEPVERPVQVSASELPLERGRDLLVAAPEGEQALLQDAEVLEVVGLEDLALHDGEVDLRLG